MKDRDRSMPWGDDEFIHCNGFGLTYRCCEGAITEVNLPGRRNMHVTDLEAWALRNNVDFALPFRIRGRRGVNYSGREHD